MAADCGALLSGSAAFTVSDVDIRMTGSADFSDI
jgi:hypothetical protein